MLTPANRSLPAEDGGELGAQVLLEAGALELTVGLDVTETDVVGLDAETVVPELIVVGLEAALPGRHWE
jgi:hypothetical protein